MAFFGLDIDSWDGHDINDGTVYSALFLREDSGILDTHTAQALEVDRPGNFPLSYRPQPDGVRIVIEITLETMSQANLDQLKEWFDPFGGERLLKATNESGNGTALQIACQVEKLAVKDSNNLFTVSLRAASGVWEAVSATTDTEAVTVTGQTWELTNAGSARAYPTLTITPNTAKNSADDYTKRRRVVLASRTEVGAMDDPEGDGYPVELGGGVLSSPGDDTRLIIKGREYDRWLSGNKLWGNLQLQPRKRATLAAGIDDTSAADITISEYTAEDNWPSKGFLVFEDTGEAVQFGSLGLQSFGDIVRGAIGTTAVAHSAGEALFLVEHGAWIDIISTKDTPGSPPFPADRMPVIDLAASTNTEHVWAGPWLNANGSRRSRAWQAVRIDDGLSSDHLRLYEDGAGKMRFEDLLPSANKPLANNAEMAFPVPIQAVDNAVSISAEVGSSLYLQALVEDIDGNESRLDDQFKTNGVTALTGSPGDELARMKLRARIAAIVGELDSGILGGTFVGVADSDTYGFHIEVQVAEDDIRSIVPDMHAAAHFTLDDESSIHAFLAYFAGIPAGCMCAVWSASGYQLDQQVGVVSFSAGSAGWNLAEISPDLVLPGGEYWLLFESPGDQGSSISVRTGRTKADLFFSLLAAPNEIPRDSDGNVVNITDGANVRRLTVADIESQIEAENLFSNNQTYTPLIAILSRENQPQSDAPFQTGSPVLISAADILLDADRAPIVNVGAEVDFYLLQAVITNNTTGKSFSLYYPMSLAEDLVIDCENRRVTDGETGLDVPFAFEGDWLYLVPGVNELQYDEAGVVDTDVASSFKSKWL